jgi:hypothetical protein
MNNGNCLISVHTIPNSNTHPVAKKSFVEFFLRRSVALQTAIKNVLPVGAHPLVVKNCLVGYHCQYPLKIKRVASTPKKI